MAESHPSKNRDMEGQGCVIFKQVVIKTVWGSDVEDSHKRYSWGRHELSVCKYKIVDEGA